MKMQYKDKDLIVEKGIKAYRCLTIIDNYGCQYGIRADKFGGIEIIACNGRVIISPNVSNYISISTKN